MFVAINNLFMKKLRALLMNKINDICTRTVHGLLTAYHYHYDVNYYMSETNTVFVERVFNKEKLFSKKC